MKTPQAQIIRYWFRKSEQQFNLSKTSWETLHCSHYNLGLAQIQTISYANKTARIKAKP